MQVCTERTSYCGVPPAYQCVSIVLENVSLLYVCCKSSACKVAFMWFPALIGLSDIFPKNALLGSPWSNSVWLVHHACKAALAGFMLQLPWAQLCFFLYCWDS